LVVEVTRDAIAAPGRLSGLEEGFLEVAGELVEQPLGPSWAGLGALLKAAALAVSRLCRFVYP
jgi:hypothetical protein